MSLARGKFGVEYNPRQRERESSGLGWVIALVALAAAVSLAVTLTRRFSRGGNPEERVVESGAKAAPDLPPLSDGLVRALRMPSALKATIAGRPQKVRNLLMRLEAAERLKDVEMAVSTLESLRALPGSPAADVDDMLARWLGTLNVYRLFELHCSQWVKTVRVRRGDGASRIAQENGSTTASFLKLNGGASPSAGATVRVMNHPRFNLVIRRRARIADLSLNGKFFKRYDLGGAVRAREGAYEMPGNRRLFWRNLGSQFGADDRRELDMLLPDGAPVFVSEM